MVGGMSGEGYRGIAASDGEAGDIERVKDVIHEDDMLVGFCMVESHNVDQLVVRLVDECLGLGLVVHGSVIEAE